MIRRRTRGAVACPHCRGLVDVRAPKCPTCGMWRPGFWGFGPALLQLRIFPVRELLLGWCVLFYAGSLLLHRNPLQAGGAPFAQLAPTLKALLALGATGTTPAVKWGRWETLLSAIFLHGNLLHLLFNCLWIWHLAPATAELYDSARFLLIFLLSAVAGNLCGCLIGRSPVLVGASGGVYGLFGAFLWYGFARGGIYGSQVFRFGLFWAALGLGLSLLVPHVAFWAHVGGLAGGIAAGALLGFEERRRSGPVLCLASAVSAVCVLVAFVSYLLFPPEGLLHMLSQ